MALTAIVYDGDIVFPQPVGIGGPTLWVDPGQHASLKGIETTRSMRLQMLYQPLRVHDDIVIYDEKNFARRGTQPPVQRIRLALPFLF
jgi:hypothetical protein